MAIDRFRFTERSAGTISGFIQDENGDGVDPATLTAATLTLYDLDTYVPGASPVVGIVNNRDAQNVNGVNDVTFPSNSPIDGEFVWAVQPADNIIVTERRQVERHLAEFTFTWSGGSFVYRCEIDVENLEATA